jgi:hypothetical protein
VIGQQEQYMSSAIRASIGHWAVAGSLALSASMAQAITITLPTTALDAQSVFTFNSNTVDVMGLFGVGVRALGNSRASASNAWAFEMPVTQVVVSASLLPLALTPVSGQTMGSALDIKGAKGELVLANFSLDFQRSMLVADLTTSGGTLKGFDVYSFHVADGLHLSTSGGLSMQMTLDQMMLTTGAQNQFASALKLPSFAKAAMATLDFGTLSIDIAPGLRFGVSDKAYAASVVPEAPKPAMLLLGLVGVAWVSRRRQTGA